MPKDTSNHSWTIPEVGLDEDQWGQILNDFFDDELDRQVKLEGTFSNRPSASSSTVKYYHATDRKIVYYNNGSSWEAIYGLGSSDESLPQTYTNELNGGVTNSNSLTDIASSGLEIASNGLQILSSIWDSNNSEITADVNNTNTTTDALEAKEVTTGYSYICIECNITF